MEGCRPDLPSSLRIGPITKWVDNYFFGTCASTSRLSTIKERDGGWRSREEEESKKRGVGFCLKRVSGNWKTQIRMRTRDHKVPNIIQFKQVQGLIAVLILSLPILLFPHYATSVYWSIKISCSAHCFLSYHLRAPHSLCKIYLPPA